MDPYREVAREVILNKVATLLAELRFKAAMLPPEASPWLNSAIALTETYFEDMSEI